MPHVGIPAACLLACGQHGMAWHGAQVQRCRALHAMPAWPGLAWPHVAGHPRRTRGAARGRGCVHRPLTLSRQPSAISEGWRGVLSAVTHEHTHTHTHMSTRPSLPACPPPQPEKGAKKGEKAAPTFVTESVPTDSFFNLFDPPKVPGATEAEAMEMEELDEVQDALSVDFEVRTRPHPHPHLRSHAAVCAAVAVCAAGVQGKGTGAIRGRAEAAAGAVPRCCTMPLCAVRAGVIIRLAANLPQRVRAPCCPCHQRTC